MDWELYERQRATLIFICVAFLSFLLLAFQRSSAVQHVKAFLVGCTFPTHRLVSKLATPPPDPHVVVSNQTPVMSTEQPPAVEVITEQIPAERARAFKVLDEENRRLNDLLNLKRERWPRLIAAHVVSRDPQRWFQEILLDKGTEDGIHVDDPVIGVSGQRQALVGRVVEVGARTSRVMLIQDSLSSVAGVVMGAQENEDGVVEGSNSHDLVLKYLRRESQIKIGDLIVTSGLGKTFPPGVPIGWVREIGLDSRELFLEAKLSPAIASTPLRTVAILVQQDRQP